MIRVLVHVSGGCRLGVGDKKWVVVWWYYLLNNRGVYSDVVVVLFITIECDTPYQYNGQRLTDMLYCMVVSMERRAHSTTIYYYIIYYYTIYYYIILQYSITWFGLPFQLWTLDYSHNFIITFGKRLIQKCFRWKV